MQIENLDSVMEKFNSSSAKTLEISSKNFSLKFVRSQSKNTEPSSKSPSPSSGQIHESAPEENKPEQTTPALETNMENIEYIRSQYIGFFSRFNPKNHNQYAKLRDQMKKNQPVAVITSMHVPHEVVTEEPCKIIEFLVEEGQPVEYGQPIARIEPVTG